MAGMTAPVTESGAPPACTAKVSNRNWARSFPGRRPFDGITARQDARPLARPRALAYGAGHDLHPTRGPAARRRGRARPHRFPARGAAGFLVRPRAPTHRAGRVDVLLLALQDREVP